MRETGAVEDDPRTAGFGAHAGSALTAAAALFVVLRLLAVARYDWHTAFALLHTLDLDDAPGIFLGTFMADERISGVLLVVLLPLTVLYLVSSRRESRRAHWGALLLVLVLVAMTVAYVRGFHRWWLPVAAAVLALLAVLVERMRRHPRLRGPVTFLRERFGQALVVAALLVAAAVSTPWVPLERIETATGTGEYHVFDVSPGFLKVLTADGHFEILRETDVRSRVELTGH